MSTKTRTPPPERFWTKVNKKGPTPKHRPELGPCWIWTGARGGYNNGYSRFRLTTHKLVYGHRYSYEQTQGPIPHKLQLDHLCRVTLCVNPTHLEPVTNQENSRRGTQLITHCPQAHKYTTKNTHIDKRGWRQCRTCNRERSRQYRQRKKGPNMNLDDYMKLIPDEHRNNFRKLLAKRDAQTGYFEHTKGFHKGYDHGWHDGQLDNTSIYHSLETQ